MDTVVLKCTFTLMDGHDVVCRKGNSYHVSFEDEFKYIIRDDNHNIRWIYKKHFEDNFRIHGYICEHHSIGFITKCPTCASIESPQKITKKIQKGIRKFLNKPER